MISLSFIFARLYMTVVPVREVLEAFFWSGVLSVAIFILLGFAGSVVLIRLLPAVLKLDSGYSQLAVLRIPIAPGTH